MKDNTARLSGTELGAALAFKILLGIIYGYIYLHYYGGDDTWRDHQFSLQETKLLLEDPHRFFINEYTPAHALAEGNGWGQVLKLYLIDLQYAMFIKSFALLNLITGGNYYINMTLFNVLVVAAHYWLFKTLMRHFREKRRLYYFGCFFYAPAAFWLSGLRIDGLLFVFVSLFIYSMVLKKKRCILVPLAFLGMFLSRPEVALLIIPPAIAFIWSDAAVTSLRKFFITYCIFLILFVATYWLIPGGGAPAAVAQIQHEFLALQGTRFNLHPLSSNPLSYFAVLPQAVANTFFRPFFWEAQGALQIMAAAEITLFWIIVLVTFSRFRHPGWVQRLKDPLVLFFLFFGVSIYLSVGYLVPFPGAIIRYKAIGLLLLVQVVIIMAKSPQIRFFNNIR